VQPWVSYSYTRESVSKHYKLVLTYAGKACLASHWPCITDTLVYPPIRAQRPTTGRWALRLCFIGAGSLHL